MQTPDERNSLRESVARIVDELCAPDLTIGRSRELRPELQAILDRLERERVTKGLAGSCGEALASAGPAGRPLPPPSAPAWRPQGRVEPGSRGDMKAPRRLPLNSRFLA